MSKGLFFAVWLLVGGAAFADVPDFRVNDDQTSAYQGYSNIAVDLDGNFVVGWYDLRNGNNDIYLQMFDRFGGRIGSNRRVNDDLGSAEQLRPSLIRDQSGRTVAVWQDFRATGYPFNGDIYLQRYLADGTAPSGNSRVNDDFGTETQGWQDIACNQLGDFVVVWEDNRNGNYDIYLQRYHRSGAKLGANLRVNDDVGTAYQHNPKVAVDAAGNFVVVWYDNRSGTDQIIGQRFAAAGTKLGTNVLLSDNVANKKCVFPDIGCDQNGNFTVAWVDYRNGSYPNNSDIYARRFGADGLPQGASFRVNDDGGSANQAEPAVGIDYFGNCIIAWRDERHGNKDIFAQYYSSSSAPVGANYRVNSDNGTATQSFPNVSMDGINIYYTWTDDRNGNFDVYARITEYGSPAIVVLPNALSFNGELGGSNPSAQPVAINNTGYGTLYWQAISDQSWVQLSPTEGLAPDTVWVQVDLSVLSYGEHSALVTVFDQAGIADSRTVVVTVNATAPLLQITPQNVAIDLVWGQPFDDDLFVSIGNAGSGVLSWSITGTPNWLDVLPLAGVAPSVVEFVVIVDSIALPSVYGAELTVLSAEAANSPQIITVTLNCTAEETEIVLSPDQISFAFSVDAAEIPSKNLLISSTGSSPFAWTATTDGDWLTIDPSEGIAETSVSISATPYLPVGEYNSTIVVTAPAASNSPQAVSVIVSVVERDQISLSSTNALRGEAFTLELSLTNYLSVDSLDFSVDFDDSQINLDSAVALGLTDATLIGIPVPPAGSARHAFRLRFSQPLGSGLRDIVGFFMRAGLDAASGDHVVTCDAISYHTSGENQQPAVATGTVTVSELTSVYEVESPIQPVEFRLGQNFPNPFNLSTVIPYQIPQRSDVMLEVLDILGRRVRLLFHGNQSPGHYAASWDGISDDRRTVATGIYFIRLSAGEISCISKAVLLK